MSPYSTIRISRMAARQFVLSKVMQSGDALLESLMDELLRERLYNVRIVNDGDGSDDDLLRI